MTYKAAVFRIIQNNEYNLILLILLDGLNSSNGYAFLTFMKDTFNLKLINHSTKKNNYMSFLAN